MSKTTDKALCESKQILEGYIPLMDVIAKYTVSMHKTAKDIKENKFYSKEYKAELLKTQNTKNSEAIIAAAISIKTKTKELFSQVARIYNALDVLEDPKLHSVLSSVGDLGADDVESAASIVRQFQGDFVSLKAIEDKASDESIKELIESNILTAEKFEEYLVIVSERVEAINHAAIKNQYTEIMSSYFVLLGVLGELGSYFGVEVY